MNINLHTVLGLGIITLLAALFAFVWSQRGALTQSFKRTDLVVFFVAFVILFLLALHYNMLTLAAP